GTRRIQRTRSWTSGSASSARRMSTGIMAKAAITRSRSPPSRAHPRPPAARGTRSASGQPASAPTRANESVTVPRSCLRRAGPGPGIRGQAAAAASMASRAAAVDDPPDPPRAWYLGRPRCTLQADPGSPDPRTPIAGRMTRCFLLLVDGLRRDLAEAELAAGSLPNLAAMVAGGGRTCGITAFPATTSVSYLPFLTGCTPGRCDVPSIRWLDRPRYRGRWWRDRAAVRSYCGYQASLLDHDIAGGVRTIFELVPESVGLFTPIARGLTPERDPTRLARKVWGA